VGESFRLVRIKEVVVLYVASLALVVLSQVSIPAQTTDLNRAGSVLTSYDDAYNRAGQEGKPILVLFTSQSQPNEIQDLRSKGLLNDFLVVVADRSTDAGRKIFSMFNMQAPEGVSVVEKTRQWQFARYDRKLNSDELARVANNSRNAAGFPTFDPLAGGVSAYPPPAQGQVAQPGQPAVYGQPAVGGVPGAPYQQAMPMQYFQPSFPMMWGGGGGCAGGSCGGGGCRGGRCR
jgi:hypothetical protein